MTTDSKNTLSPAPDRLQRQFDVSQHDKAWVSDTTFIATRQGWLYLAVIIDLFSLRITGWSMRDKNNSALVEVALTMATWRRSHKRRVVVYSDKGSAYASGDYQGLLRLVSKASRPISAEVAVRCFSSYLASEERGMAVLPRPTFPVKKEDHT